MPAEQGDAAGSLRALGTPLPSQRAGRAGRSLGQSPDFLNLNIALRFGDGAGEPTCAGGFVYSLVGNLLFLRMAAFCFILWSWVCLLVCRCRKKMYRIYKKLNQKAAISSQICRAPSCDQPGTKDPRKQLRGSGNVLGWGLRGNDGSKSCQEAPWVCSASLPLRIHHLPPASLQTSSPHPSTCSSTSLMGWQLRGANPSGDRAPAP